jgi:hypothetical protein
MKATIDDKGRTVIRTAGLVVKVARDESERGRKHGIVHLFGSAADHMPCDAGKRIAAAAAGFAGVSFDALSFSRVAGCSCGCSPGFVLRNAGDVVLYVDVLN